MALPDIKRIFTKEAVKPNEKAPLFDVNVWLNLAEGNFDGNIQGDLDHATFTANNGTLKLEGIIKIVPANVDGGHSARRTIFEPQSSNYPNIIISEDLNHSTWGRKK